MEGVDRETALRLEKVRILLDYSSKEYESHRQNHLISFASLFGAGLAAVGSTILERVPAVHGLPLAALMFLGAGYAQVQIRRLPPRRRAATFKALRAVDRLIGWERD